MLNQEIDDGVGYSSGGGIIVLPSRPACKCLVVSLSGSGP